jgi:RPA family protein
VVAEEISAQLLGRRYRLTGSVVGTYFLVDHSERCSDHSDLSDDAIEPALTARQPARRVFAQELNASTQTFKESDAERAPLFGLSPTGTALNRVLVIGTLTETRDVGSDSEYWQGRVYADSEPVFVYAGQYQPDAMEALRQAETPSYVAVVGKHRSYESGDRTNVALEPEFVIPVDEETRDAWVEETVGQTSARINAFEAGRAPFGERARRAYGEDMSGLVEAVEAIDGTADE